MYMKRRFAWLVLLLLAAQSLRAQEYPTLRSAWRTVVGKSGLLATKMDHLTFYVESGAPPNAKVVSVGSDNVVFIEEKSDRTTVTVIPLNLILLDVARRR